MSMHWAVVATSDGLIHVVPTFGREHDFCEHCWCRPQWDDEKLNVLIHSQAEGHYKIPLRFRTDSGVEQLGSSEAS